jgi:hypothetical protein
MMIDLAVIHRVWLLRTVARYRQLPSLSKEVERVERKDLKGLSEHLERVVQQKLTALLVHDVIAVAEEQLLLVKKMALPDYHPGLRGWMAMIFQVE